MYVENFMQQQYLKKNEDIFMFLGVTLYKLPTNLKHLELYLDGNIFEES